MKFYKYPEIAEWDTLCERPTTDGLQLEKLVRTIFGEVRRNGDEALKRYSLSFDKVVIEDFRIEETTIKAAGQSLSSELKNAIQRAKENIEVFHKSQEVSTQRIETSKGIQCWQESRAIERVGIYIPGGTAPLFSTVLMLGIPAMIAGCKEIVLVSPPNKEGNIDPAILYTADLIGIKNIYRIGGIQAIAALSLPNTSIPKVDKIFGPGNQYVTAAKKEAQNLGLAIDMPAGPSEVLVIADPSCPVEFVAADLLAQAEHGPDSQVILLGTDEQYLLNCQEEVAKQLERLPRKNLASMALKNSKTICLASTDQCMEFSNQYAPEHLIIACENAEQWITKISNAGSVFIGKYSCESAGDYASGTNHTLPTNGFAKNYSGVTLGAFKKTISFQTVSAEGLIDLGPAIEVMAEAEQLFAHKNAVSVRLKSLADV